MSYRTLFVALTFMLLTLPQLALAAERATEEEAVALVKKAVIHYKSAGSSALSDFSEPSQKFVNKDLYITVTGLTGNVLAHGKNGKLVGKNLIALKDPDGKEFIKEMVELGKSKGSFWTEYKFTDPVTKEVLPKKVYCETVDQAVICGGIYKGK